jgi:hypothetical protein
MALLGVSSLADLDPGRLMRLPLSGEKAGESVNPPT